MHKCPHSTARRRGVCSVESSRALSGHRQRLQVRQLGRGGGIGPKRRAPEQLYASGCPPGVLRSTLVPEEVRGLHKTGDLSQMLPAEAGLMAVGWPQGDSDGVDPGADLDVGEGAGSNAQDSSESDERARQRRDDPVGTSTYGARLARQEAGAGHDAAGRLAPASGAGGGSATAVAERPKDADAALQDDIERGGRSGFHPARLLFLARMAEKGLLSYQRAGVTPVTLHC